MSDNTASRSENSGYEKRDVTGRGIAVFAIAFVGVTVALIVVLTLFVRAYWLLPQVATTLIQDQIVSRPEPSLQSDPGRDLEMHLAEKRQRLNSFDWVAREEGVARIPIDEAMRLLAERPPGKAEE